MDFLRECCGDKLILGCGVPLGAAFGKVDACRTGCDADLKYTGRFYNTLNINNEVPSTKNSIINAIFRRHLDGRAFCCDPDVFFLRSSNLTFTKQQKLLLAAVNNLCGNVLFISDNVDELNDEEIEILKTTFTKNNSRIISADMNADKVEIAYVENMQTKSLKFDIAKGEIYE